MFKGRQVDIHYSTPKAEDLGKRCDRDKNQGTVLLELSGTKQEFTQQELQSHLSQFGDIKDVRIVGGLYSYITPAKHTVSFGIAERCWLVLMQWIVTLFSAMGK
jgi:hypothetical protein